MFPAAAVAAAAPSHDPSLAPRPRRPAQVGTVGGAAPAARYLGSSSCRSIVLSRSLNQSTRAPVSGEGESAHDLPILSDRSAKIAARRCPEVNMHEKNILIQNRQYRRTREGASRLVCPSFITPGMSVKYRFLKCVVEKIKSSNYMHNLFFAVQQQKKFAARACVRAS